MNKINFTVYVPMEVRVYSDGTHEFIIGKEETGMPKITVEEIKDLKLIHVKLSEGVDAVELMKDIHDELGYVVYPPIVLYDTRDLYIEVLPSRLDNILKLLKEVGR